MRKDSGLWDVCSLKAQSREFPTLADRIRRIALCPFLTTKMAKMTKSGLKQIRHQFLGRACFFAMCKPSGLRLKVLKQGGNFRLEGLRKKKTLSRAAQGRSFTIDAISEGEIEQLLVEILLEQVRRCLLVA